MQNIEYACRMKMQCPTTKVQLSGNHAQNRNKCAFIMFMHAHTTLRAPTNTRIQIYHDEDPMFIFLNENAANMYPFF